MAKGVASSYFSFWDNLAEMSYDDPKVLEYLDDWLAKYNSI